MKTSVNGANAAGVATRRKVEQVDQSRRRLRAGDTRQRVKAGRSRGATPPPFTGVLTVGQQTALAKADAITKWPGAEKWFTPGMIESNARQCLALVNKGFFDTRLGRFSNRWEFKVK